jgi:hypothetical protein
MGARSSTHLDMYLNHELINYKDTKATCRYLKKLAGKGTLRQVFIRFYTLEVQSVMLVFSTQLCELLPLSPSLLSIPPPPPRVNKYTIVYTFTLYIV